VLVLAVEDYSGNSAFPAYPGTNGPFFLDYYADALERNGIEFDVYDYDAEGRTAPDPLGVLSHYDAVIWYTGNDNAMGGEAAALSGERMSGRGLPRTCSLRYSSSQPPSHSRSPGATPR
jgi:hypothetical protein